MASNNTVIFGDSYSTFRGAIPQGYAVYYSETGSGQTDVHSIEETWWHLLMTETGSNLVRNDSWSGSTICNTGYSGDCSKTSSFLHRLDLLNAEGFFRANRVDTVFVFGGTNDNWCGAPLGDILYENIPQEELFKVLPGFSQFMQNLKATVPAARIICLINCNLKPALADGYAEICEHLGIQSIRLHDIDKAGGHPTVLGMKQIKAQILAALGA